MVTGRTVQIGDREVGPGQPCFIVAEAGVNHNGQIELAEQLVDIAIEAGADAVKFQTFKAERVVSACAPKADYQLRTTDAAESQLDMLRGLELSADDHRTLMARCAERNILFLSSAFDESSADLLNELGVAAFKIPSGEITNLPFLDHIARMGKSMIMSTGMSTLGEVETAVKTIRDAGNNDLVLLHCVSNYPADPADVNLRAMATMATAFSVPTGYSDHMAGIEVALAAVAMGACVIEKHFTTDRNLVGPDHEASVQPDELKALVRGVRIVESALGDGCKTPAASEANTAAVARKSLVAAQDVSAGTTLTDELVAVKRPGTGLPPSMLQYVLGRSTQVDLAADTIIDLGMLL